MLIIILFSAVVWKTVLGDFHFPISGFLTFLKHYAILAAFLFYLMISVFLSKSPSLGLWAMLKFLEFIFFAFYILRKVKREKDFLGISLIFSVGVIFESLLSIIQYLNQRSINGVFYFFGERFFNSQTPGIANATLGGELILRPYGTFPHPNVLAGYLTIAMVIVISNFHSARENLKKTIYIFALILGSAALILTMSRIAIILWLSVLCLRATVYFGNFFKKSRIKLAITCLVFFFFVLSVLNFTPLRLRFLETNFTNESFVLRGQLIKTSFSMFKSSPVFGVGPNNFLVNLPFFQKTTSNIFYLQPVHNIYLLVLAETGFFGLLFFLLILFRAFKKSKMKPIFRRTSLKLQLLFIVVFLGFFDHYFLTVQQGQLLFAFVLGFCFTTLTKASKFKV